MHSNNANTTSDLPQCFKKPRNPGQRPPTGATLRPGEAENCEQVADAVRVTHHLLVTVLEIYPASPRGEGGLNIVVGEEEIPVSAQRQCRELWTCWWPGVYRLALQKRCLVGLGIAQSLPPQYSLSTLRCELPSRGGRAKGNRPLPAQS